MEFNSPRRHGDTEEGQEQKLAADFADGRGWKGEERRLRVAMIFVALERDDGIAASVSAATGMEVRRGSLPELVDALKREELRAFVVERSLMENEAAELVWTYAGAAVPVIVNSTVQGCGQMTREVQTALQRRERERQAAREAERTALQAEMAGPLSGLLVNLAVALEDKKLARVTRIRLERVQRIAEGLARRGD